MDWRVTLGQISTLVTWSLLLIPSRAFSNSLEGTILRSCLQEIHMLLSPILVASLNTTPSGSPCWWFTFWVSHGSSFVPAYSHGGTLLCIFSPSTRSLVFLGFGSLTCCIMASASCANVISLTYDSRFHLLPSPSLSFFVIAFFLFGIVLRHLVPFSNTNCHEPKTWGSRYEPKTLWGEEISSQNYN